MLLKLDVLKCNHPKVEGGYLYFSLSHYVNFRKLREKTIHLYIDSQFLCENSKIFSCFSLKLQRIQRYFLIHVKIQ